MQLSREQEERVYAGQMSMLQAAVYVQGGGWMPVYPPATVGGVVNGISGQGRRGNDLPGVDSRARSGNEPRRGRGRRRHSDSDTSSSASSSESSDDEGYDSGAETLAGTETEAPSERPFGLQTIRAYLSRDGRTVEELAVVMYAGAGGEPCWCCGFSYESEDGQRLQQVIDALPVASVEGSGGLWA